MSVARLGGIVLSGPQPPRRAIDSLPYLACSRHVRLGDGELDALATRLGAIPLTRRPLPAGRIGLVLTTRGPVLHAPGCAPLAWHPGLTASRLVAPMEDTLVRALDVQPGQSVVDATLGLGHDALVLRAAGAVVLGLEANPLLAYLTELGHASHAVGLPLTVWASDFRDVLAALEPTSVDHVFFDPLFDAPGTHGLDAHPVWDAVRRLGRPGRLTPDDVATARRVARHRVVLKLGPGESPPGAPGFVLVVGRRRRFAVWGAAETP